MRMEPGAVGGQCDAAGPSPKQSGDKRLDKADCESLWTTWFNGHVNTRSVPDATRGRQWNTRLPRSGDPSHPYPPSVGLIHDISSFTARSVDRGLVEAFGHDDHPRPAVLVCGEPKFGDRAQSGLLDQVHELFRLPLVGRPTYGHPAVSLGAHRVFVADV